MVGCLNDDPFKVPSSSRRIINLFNLALWTMEDGGETIIPFIGSHNARALWSIWSIMLGTRWKRMETMVSFTMVKDSYTNIQVRSTGMPNIHTVTIQSWYKLCQSVVGVVVVENVITLIQHHTLYSVSYSIQTP